MKKIQLGFRRLIAAAIALFAAGAVALSSSAATLYTNTWANTAGVGTVKNWGDAANWSVTYEPDVTPPASAVPTDESFVKLQSNASITLQPGDDYSVGQTYFLAGTAWKTLNMEIPTGSRLSLVGSDNSSYLGVGTAWQDGPVNNSVKIDVNGGELVVGQSLLSMRPNMANASSKGYNWIQIRNGGKLSMEDGSTLRLWGGQSDNSSGKGIYTNIVDVLEDSTLELNGSAVIAMGANINRNNPHAGGSYFGAGWVNVKGGTLTATNSTFEAPILMATSMSTGMGAFLNVTDGGKVNLGGKRLYVMSKNTNIVYVASGGVISNFTYYVQQGGGTGAQYHNMIDIDGGKVFMTDCSFMRADATPGTVARATFRIHGGDSILDVDNWKWGMGTASYSSTPPIFADFRLKAHTIRDADFAVRPIRTRTAVWDGAHGGAANKNVHGIYRLSPDGGLQLIHKDSFELLCRANDSQGNYEFTGTYGGVIGNEMWATNCTRLTQDSALNAYVGAGSAYVFQVLLKDEAKLTDGVELAQPKPRAWLQLPSFTAKQIDIGKTERVSVRLDLIAPEGGSLDLDGVVAKMREEGGQNAYADDSVAGYNVRVDLPMNELAAGTGDDKIIMDFVSCETYGQAFGAQPMTTNALIRAATCETVEMDQTGFTLTVY